MIILLQQKDSPPAQTVFNKKSATKRQQLGCQIQLVYLAIDLSAFSSSKENICCRDCSTSTTQIFTTPDIHHTDTTLCVKQDIDHTIHSHGVLKFWCGGCLIWWMSFFTHGVVDVWCGGCPVWYMSSIFSFFCLFN